MLIAPMPAEKVAECAARAAEIEAQLHARFAHDPAMAVAILVVSLASIARKTGWPRDSLMDAVGRGLDARRDAEMEQLIVPTRTF